MVHGKTEDMRKIDSEQQFKGPEYVEGSKWKAIEMGEGKRLRLLKPRGLKPVKGASRDRSLRGKARIKARKAS